MTAHHFQRADAHHEQCVREAMARVGEDAWGCNEVEFDESALAKGRLELRRAEITFPDLTEVCIGPGDRPLSRALPDLGTRESVGIYLGIPAIQPDRPNAAPAGDILSHTRYAIATHAIPDEANGKKPIDAEWLRPNPWLLADGDRTEGFDLIQCARLTSDSKGRPVFDRAFVPPIWRIRASPYLIEQLEELLALLRSRKAWADHWKPLPALKERRRALRGFLGGFVKGVSDLLDRNATSPHDAYLKLIEVMHTLAAFTPDGDAPLPLLEDEDGADATDRLPAFNHLALGKTFSAMFDVLRAILATIGAEQHLEVPTPLAPGNEWARLADLNKHPGIFRMAFVLAVSGADLAALREEVPQRIKIAPLQDLLGGKYSMQPGLPVHWAPRPHSLPEVSGTVYFQLDKTSDIWTAISREARMGIQYNQIDGLANIALYAVDPDAL